MKFDGKWVLPGAVIIIVIVIIVSLLFRRSGQKGEVKMSDTTNTNTTTNTTNPTTPSAANPTPAELKIENEVIGTGAAAVAGKTVTVNYIGTLLNGTKFDSSYDRSQPFQFNLGAGQVIAGWDQGLVGMKVGGKRKLTIPPALGYGSNQAGPIPPNSTLVFEVELLGVN